MTWSYSVGDLATSAKDQVRLAIGDTISTSPQLQDEEITQFLGTRANIYGAAAECCRALATQYSRSVNQKGAMSSINFSDMSKAYAARALQFEAQSAQFGAGMPYAGGISISDKASQELNDDRVTPQFQIGMDDDTVPLPPAGLVILIEP